MSGVKEQYKIRKNYLQFHFLSVEYDDLKKKYSFLVSKFAEYTKATENVIKDYKEKVIQLENKIKESKEELTEVKNLQESGLNQRNFTSDIWYDKNKKAAKYVFGIKSMWNEKNVGLAQSFKQTLIKNRKRTFVLH